MINYTILEQHLKKRINNLPYSWKKPQDNNTDSKTKIIYNIRSYAALIEAFKNESTDLKNYAYNRWLNFWSAKAIEDFFKNNPNVTPEKNQYHKTIDFYINGVGFDHKTSVLPQDFKDRLEDLKREECQIELIKWLYSNQSQEQRKHFGNRVFVVLINNDNLNQSWKLKGELTQIKKYIDNYLFEINSGNRKYLTFNKKENDGVSHRFHSDLILIESKDFR